MTVTIKGTWDSPVSVDTLAMVTDELKQVVGQYRDLVEAVNDIDLRALHGAYKGRISWGNFQHVYREVLLYYFGESVPSSEARDQVAPDENGEDDEHE